MLENTVKNNAAQIAKQHSVIVLKDLEENLAMKYEPKPIFSKYYISPKNKKTAFVTLFFIMLTATVFSFGLGGYIRNNTKRNNGRIGSIYV
ncbi:hypothetical protein HZS_6586 [Henneguya salminicola]|nr:hypothetical protein HZS_6586 [Henneguya salminicola]